MGALENLTDHEHPYALAVVDIVVVYRELGVVTVVDLVIGHRDLG